MKNLEIQYIREIRGEYKQIMKKKDEFLIKNYFPTIEGKHNKKKRYKYLSLELKNYVIECQKIRNVSITSCKKSLYDLVNFVLYRE